MAHRHKHQKAKGGRMSFVNAPTEKEAGNKKDSFKRGGHAHEHKAHGHKSKPRADKRARGGGVGGHSPFSSAAKGNDMGRHSAHPDKHQPRAAGGAVGLKRGGRAGGGMVGMGGAKGMGKSRPSPFAKSAFNFGAHHGSGHEEPLQSHPPVHEKHGGRTHGNKSHKVHHAGHGAHKAHHPGHGGHHAGHHGHGRKARAHGGKVDGDKDHEHEDGEEEDEPERRKHGGALTEVSKRTSKGGLHRSLGIPEGERIGAKRIAKATHSSNPKTRREANLAQTYEKHRP